MKLSIRNVTFNEHGGLTGIELSPENITATELAEFLRGFEEARLAPPSPPLVNLRRLRSEITILKPDIDVDAVPTRDANAYIQGHDNAIGKVLSLLEQIMNP